MNGCCEVFYETRATRLRSPTLEIQLPTVMAVENSSPPAIPLIGAFESTYQPLFDRDVMETTQHDVRWRDDLALLSSCNVRQLRYPIRWHRIEPERGVFD